MISSDGLRPHPVPLGVQLARARAFVWRFRTLALAHRVFAGTAANIYRRPYRAGHLLVEIARSSTQQLLFLEGERFVAERGLLRRLLRPGMRVLDVGANIGYYLLLVEDCVGPDGEILCVEPEADNLRELRRNIASNGFRNVTVLPVAAGSVSGEVSLRPGFNGTVVAAEPGARQVAMVRLDDVVTAPLDFVKIDVEGYEGHVLEGAAQLLHEGRPRLFIELHPGFLAPSFTVDGILEPLLNLYPSVQLFEASPEHGLVRKLRARYLGRGIRPVPAPGVLLRECRQGRRQDTFWAVCGPAPLAWPGQHRSVGGAGQVRKIDFAERTNEGGA